MDIHELISNKLIEIIFNESNLIYNQILRESNATTIEVIYSYTLKDLLLPVIPMEEQDKIIDFLDEKVGEINSVIARTKETIEDYKKYKQTIITDAVARGVDDTVTLKATENIHIDKIPMHWDMKKLKYVFYIKKDIAGKEGYDILSITQKGIKVKDISNNEGQLAESYSNYQLVDIGDFAMNHMDLLTGWVDISKYSGVTSPDYRVFNFINRATYCKEYYLYLTLVPENLWFYIIPPYGG